MELILRLTIHDVYEDNVHDVTVKEILSNILNIIARLEKEMLESKIGENS